MSERRRDPLTGEWRTFAAERMDRALLLPPGDCPFCPTVPGGLATEIPVESFDVVVLDDRFPPLGAATPSPDATPARFYPVEPARGASEVVVYTDVHDTSFADLSPARVKLVVDVWADRYDELGRRDDVAYVLVFENRGAALGITLPHPHGQVHAYQDIPPAPARELAHALAYHDEHDACVLCDVVSRELAEGVRVVSHNRSFLAYVPFAARFPYEVHVVPLRHATSLLELTDPERWALATLLLEVTGVYDALFGDLVSYVMAIHQEPCEGGSWGHVSHLHVELMPMHRPHGKVKVLGGPELGAGTFVGDVMPETTAGELRRAVRRTV